MYPRIFPHELQCISVHPIYLSEMIVLKYWAVLQPQRLSSLSSSLNEQFGLCNAIGWEQFLHAFSRDFCMSLFIFYVIVDVVQIPIEFEDNSQTIIQFSCN